MKDKQKAIYLIQLKDVIYNIELLLKADTLDIDKIKDRVSELERINNLIKNL